LVTVVSSIIAPPNSLIGHHSDIAEWPLHASFGVYAEHGVRRWSFQVPQVHLSCSDQETVSGSTALSRMPTALVVLFGLFGLGFGVGYAVRKRRSRMRRRSYYHDD
jgi:hypothetical protein